ncbi:MAG: hypothetical protein ACE5FE_00750 [Acidiferrobacterales bacterium]
MYDIVYKQSKQTNMDVLGAWGLYLVVIASLAGYHLVQIFW